MKCFWQGQTLDNRIEEQIDWIVTGSAMEGRRINAINGERRCEEHQRRNFLTACWYRGDFHDRGTGNRHGVEILDRMQRGESNSSCRRIQIA